MPVPGAWLQGALGLTVWGLRWHGSELPWMLWLPCSLYISEELRRV